MLKTPTSKITTTATLNTTSARTSSVVVSKNTKSNTQPIPTTTQPYLIYASKQYQEHRMKILDSIASSTSTDQQHYYPPSSNSSSCWSKALTAYHSAIFSGSNIGEMHTYSAVRSVVKTISKMPQNSASRVLSSLGSLSEESPQSYGPHCIEAASNCCVKDDDDRQQQQRQLLPTQKKMKLASSSSSSPHFESACQTLSKHRLSLIDSNHKVACKAVTNCMNEGRWDAALRIAVHLPNLVRFNNNNDATTRIVGNTRTTSRGSSIHLAAYMEALNQAVRQDHQKAVSTLLQVIQQQQQQNTNNNNQDKLTSSSSPTPSFFLNGLTSNDVKKMILDFEESTEQGWRVASLLFGAREFELKNRGKNANDESENNNSQILFDPSVVHASLTVLASQNKWQEATKILQMKVSTAPNESNSDNAHHMRRKDTSAVISTAVKVLRQSPWNVALELVSKLCASSSISHEHYYQSSPSSSSSPTDHQAAADVATMVLRLGKDASWEHAAAAFNFLRQNSTIVRNNNTTRLSYQNNNLNNSSSFSPSTSSQVTIEAILSSRLTVKLLNDGRPDLAAKALRHVRATRDRHSLSKTLDAFVGRSKSIQESDTWITTMIEEGMSLSKQSKEHVIRLYCDQGNWVQALCAVRDLEENTSDNNNNNASVSFDEENTISPSTTKSSSSKRIICPRTHVYLQRALRASGARWDVAVRTFVEVEANSQDDDDGAGRNNNKSDDSSIQQIAEAFRSVVATCMEQQKEEVAQSLLSIMIQKGVGRRR